MALSNTVPETLHPACAESTVTSGRGGTLELQRLAATAQRRLRHLFGNGHSTPALCSTPLSVLLIPMQGKPAVACRLCSPLWAQLHNSTASWCPIWQSGQLATPGMRVPEYSRETVNLTTIIAWRAMPALQLWHCS